MGKKIITTALVLALGFTIGAIGTADAGSPLSRLSKQVKRAVAQSGDAKHDVGVLSDDMAKREREMKDRQADVERGVQAVNGRVSALPDTFGSNVTHEHVGHGTIAADSKETASASCEPGESIVSGGYSFDTNQGVNVAQPQVVSESIVGNSWLVTVNNLNRDGNVDVDVFANCVPQ
jgi:hypothetical protein